MSEPAVCSVDPRHELQPTERGTCTVCTGRVRADLHAITTAYNLLPLILEVPLGSNAPSDRTRSDEKPMPGGDALVLMAGGGSGWAAMQRVRSLEAKGLPTKDEPPFGADDYGHDPASVAWELGRHEDHWRRVRREPAAEHPYLVDPAARYLLEHLGWAAKLPEFPEFAHDIATLRLRLELATGTNDQPLRGEAPCLDCGGELHRRYRPATPARDPEHWGLEDDWACRACGETHDDARYAKAVAQALHTQAEAGGDGPWVPVDLAAEQVSLPWRTVQSWARRGRIPHRRRDGQLEVRLFSTIRLAKERANATPKGDNHDSACPSADERAS